jgi:hypothetical protein
MQSPKFFIGLQVIARDDSEVYVGFINDVTLSTAGWIYLLSKEQNTLATFSGTPFAEAEIVYYLESGHWNPVNKPKSTIKTKTNRPAKAKKRG